MTALDLKYDTRRILCAVDQSEPSLRAARLALDLAGKCRAELTLLSVVHQSDADQPEMTEFLQHEHVHEMPGIVIRNAALSDLYQLRDQIATDSGVAIKCEVRVGETAIEIVLSAKDHAIDLLVVGHRGHTLLASILLGGVARRVIETAACPVLVVR